MKGKTIGRKQIFFSIILSYVTVLGISVKMNLQDMTWNLPMEFIISFTGFSMTQVFQMLGLCALYCYILTFIGKQHWKKRDIVCVVIPAGLFAAFMVVGYSFQKTGSLALVISNGLQKMKSASMWAGYFIAFSMMIAYVFAWMPTAGLVQAEQGFTSRERSIWWRYSRRLVSRPFSTAFLTLLAAYIPYMVLSYPSIFQGDTWSMVLQGFNLPSYTSNYLILIDESVRLNGHHPILYTMYIHACLAAGKTLFNSYNIGAFIASLLQALTVFAVMSYAVTRLVQRQTNLKIIVGILAFYIFAPRVQSYMFLLSKDILCGSALLLFVISISDILQKDKVHKRDVLLGCLSGIAVGLLRNDGKYIILASLVLAIILLRKYRKPLFAMALIIAAVVGMFFGVLMPALHITPSSRREALSVPFQQTARYLRDCGNEVTEEEKAAISAVLDYDRLGELYDPTKSDAVKGTFREAATSAEMIEYFKVWAKMGINHPSVYVEATINNYYNYFYPGSVLAGNYSYQWSEECMRMTCEDAAANGLEVNIHYPTALNRWRNYYEIFREKVFELPVLSLLKSPAVYVWALILLVFYLFKNGTKEGFILTIPLILSVVVCLLGPCNGDYFRYLYGTHLCLPVVSVLSMFFNCKKDNGDSIDEPCCCSDPLL